MMRELEVDLKNSIKKVLQMNKIAIAKFIIPFCIAGVTVIFFLFFVPPEVSTKYAWVISVYTFVPIGGPIAVIPVGLGLGIPPVALVSFLVFTDAILSMFLVWNFDYAKKIPGIGNFIEKAEEKGEEAMKKYKWAKGFEFIGVVIFVIFPLQWTGSSVGSILGRLIGMTPMMTWLAVILGTSIRSTLFTLISIGVLSFIK
jgi:uncharacterized membrane protein